VPFGFSSEFFDILMKYNWPGNVRELFNTIERIMMVARMDPIIYPMHLPPYIRIKVSQPQATNIEVPDNAFFKSICQPEDLPKFKEFQKNALSVVEHDYFKKLMFLTNGNIKEACLIAGLSRSRLYALLKKHHISDSD
jgi:two-component system NtrC family response regulator